MGHTQHQRKTIILPFLILFLLISCAKQQAIPSANSDALNWQTQYDLGMRYLSEGNYEEAILAFTAAIEIDPKNPAGYLSAAQAYIGLEDSAGAEDILRQGMEYLPENAEISSRLAEILMTPHRLSFSNSKGEDIVVFGQTDLEGRLQGFCIMNVFEPGASELVYLAEGEYLDGELVGVGKQWWFRDKNVNEDYGVDNGCGRSVGERVNGERNGFNTVECFIGYTIAEVAENEMIRWDDCAGITPVYTYIGNYINGVKHDDTGDAYLMYISHSEAHSGQKVEYIGQMADDHRTGYGTQWRDGVLDHEGYFDNSRPIR